MASQNFARALAATLKFEGGYVNHPADPGGPTNMGVTQATLSAWRGHRVSVADVRALARPEVAAIFRRNYWELTGCDHLPAGLDIAVFDYAVNSGVPRASRAVQAVVGVTVDGIVGTATINAARAMGAQAAVLALGGQRRGFLRQLRIFTTFGRGWLARVAAIESLALSLAASEAPLPTRSHSPFPPTTETPMNFSKSFVESRTIWSNLIGLAALAASFMGYDASSVDQAAMLDAVLKSVAGAGFVASTIFRIKATRKLS